MMELKEIMEFKNFVVLGNTINPEKYAYKIKEELIEHGYNVACVGKELASINDVKFPIEVLDLCINPNLGIKYLMESFKTYKVVVIQPGAESKEIFDFLEENNIQYIEGCLLLGINLFKK